MNLYPIERELSLPETANPRHGAPSLTEVIRAEKRGRGFPRWIGGDKGDLGFHGYTVEGDRTVLDRPVLSTCLDDLNADEAAEIAEEVLLNAYASVGTEAVEHC